MKNTLRFPAFGVLATFILAGCSKDSPATQTTIAPASPSRNQSSYSPMARYSGPDYSQSISLDSANSMIGSYLASVNYPAVDTGLRSISFDADTLRAYLQNNDIKTLKFAFAHRPAYKAQKGGVYSGMNPNALTFIIVGQDENDNYILNNRNQVYDNSLPCPIQCGLNADVYIH